MHPLTKFGAGVASGVTFNVALGLLVGGSQRSAALSLPLAALSMVPVLVCGGPEYLVGTALVLTGWL